MVSAYCLGYQNFTVIPHQMEEDFKEMVSTGFDTVCLSFSESEMAYSRRTFEIQVELAKKCGLNVHVVPSRIGGRFAGAPLMSSLWLEKHPEYMIKTDFRSIACLEAREFRAWIKEYMKILLTDYDLSGIVWDEPKGVGVISHHPETIKKYGENPTADDMVDSFIDFMEELSAYCNSLRPGIVQTLFAQPGFDETTTQKISKIKHLEYFGYDGAIAKVSFFKETPVLKKKMLKDVWQRTASECAEAGKKTFALVENMLMPKSELDAFAANFEDYLKSCSPDHLSVYYYAHNNENPEAVHQIVKRTMKKYL